MAWTNIVPGGFSREPAHAPKQSDTEHRPIYLESSSPSNTRYYKRFGFEVKREIALTRGPVPVELTIMVREPQAGGFGGFGMKA